MSNPYVWLAQKEAHALLLTTCYQKTFRDEVLQIAQSHTVVRIGSYAIFRDGDTAAFPGNRHPNDPVRVQFVLLAALYD